MTKYKYNPLLKTGFQEIIDSGGAGASGDTIYNQDGVLTGDRTVSGDTHSISFENVSEFNVNDKDVYDLIRCFFRTGEGINLLSEFSVGSIEQPFESIFGEGDSTPEDMLVYQYDGTGYTEVSSEAQSASGSTFSLADGTTGNMLYVTCDKLQNGEYYKAKGIKAKLTRVLSLGTGETIFEYWNGSSYEEVNVMSTRSDNPYTSYAKEAFTHIFVPNQEHIYFDIKMQQNWQPNDPPSLGTDRYWFRYRIVDGVSTTPEFEQFKIHTNRFESNVDGWVQMFGNARELGTLAWDSGLWIAANDSPSNQDVYISDNMGVGRRENLFANGVTDRSGFATYLPFECDTSSKIKIIWSCITNDNSGGNIEWILRNGYSNDLDFNDVYTSTASAPTTAPNEQSQTIVVAAPTANNKQTTYEAYIDVSNMIARRIVGQPDLLWVTLQRSGAGGLDSHTGNVGIINIAGQYLKWCQGAHVVFLERIDGFFEDFEGGIIPSGWTTVNSAIVTNDWEVGTAEAQSGTNSLYISNDGGTTADYSSSTPDNISHIYFDYALPTGITEPHLTFYWKCEGENGGGIDDYDFMRTYIAPTSVTPVADTFVSSAYQLGRSKYLEESGWIFTEIPISATYTGETIRVIFSFKSDFSITNAPSACVDNVTIYYLE